MQAITAPILESLNKSNRILLAGAGGGYDIFGGIPLYFELKEIGKEVHLANYSFTKFSNLPSVKPEHEAPYLFQVLEDSAAEDFFCPEAWLANWLHNETGEKIPIWCFTFSGTKPLQQSYQYLIERYKLDAIILMDGGIDLILKGDEASIGTPAEDLSSLYVVQKANVSVKLVSCVGFGSELRDGICHEQVFDRIAELTQKGGFLGMSSLINRKDSTQKYRSAVEYVFGKQTSVKKSHVHSLILKSLDGEFGWAGEKVWISPLLSLYWFFSLQEVANSHIFLENLGETEHILEVVQYIEELRKRMNVREKTKTPI